MRARHAVLALLLPPLLVACSSVGTLPEDAARAGLHGPVELVDTPFHPQTAYQCGPAALATVLGASGRVVAPAELAPQVQLPERRGSLQVELVAAARRHGVVPYVIRPAAAALLAELHAGRPVLVLQNLALQWFPQWHYAVVIGYDPRLPAFILRSGGDARRVVKAGPFLRSWALADHWGLVVLEPGALPAADDPTGYLRAAAGLEAVGEVALAAQAYGAAVRRWPGEPRAWLALGNARHALGDLHGAEAAYGEALARAPHDVVALNNLAETLAARGCLAAARARIAEALAVPGGPEHLRSALRRTAAELQRRTGPRREPADCPAGQPR